MRPRSFVILAVVIAASIGASTLVALDRAAEPDARRRPRAAVVLEGALFPEDPPRASWSPLPSPTPSPSPSPSKVAAPSPKPSPPLVAKPAAPRVDLSAFRGLGAWVDLFDLRDVDPVQASAHMASEGVRTLYLQTSRFTRPEDIIEPATIDAWVRAAHANRMRVVGWYLPGYGDLERDVRRTIAIARFRTSDGQRFDAIGVDIEDKCELDDSSPCSGVPQRKGFTHERWNAAIVEHATRVRAAVGRTTPVAAITLPPLGMAIRPAHWAGFPWRALPRSFDVLMPMAYWGYRNDCAEDPNHCPYGYTKGNVTEVRRLTGGTLPVHVIGGVGDDVTDDEISDFVRGARDARAIGGSMYDYRTTSTGAWQRLRPLNRL